MGTNHVEFFVRDVSDLPCESQRPLATRSPLRPPVHKGKRDGDVVFPISWSYGFYLKRRDGEARVVYERDSLRVITAAGCTDT